MIENQTNKAGTGAWTTGRISSRGNEPLAVKSSSTRGSTHLSMLSIFLSHRDLKMAFFFLSLLMSPYGMHPELLLLVYPLCYNANECMQPRILSIENVAAGQVFSTTLP